MRNTDSVQRGGRASEGYGRRGRVLATMAAAIAAVGLTVAPTPAQADIGSSCGTSTTVDLSRTSSPVLGAPLHAQIDVNTGDCVGTGTVSVIIDGTPLHTLEVTLPTPPESGHTVSYPVPLEVVGSHSVSAKFTATSRSLRDSQTRNEAPYLVVRADTQLVADVPAELTAEAPVTLAVVALDSGAVPSGAVTVSEAGEVREAVTLHNGQARISLAGLAAGQHTLNLDYAGDANTNPSSVPITVTLPPRREGNDFDLSGPGAARRHEAARRR